MADDFSRRRLVMTGKQLKNSILQWAIQGKLVPQDPNDEPASVLLEKIRAEKARLIKEGKIKKDKNESIIFRGEDNSYYEKFADGKVVCIDDEIPFDVPKGWSLARFGTVVYNRDSERIPLSVSERSRLTKTYDYYGASGVIDKVDKYLFDKNLLLIGEDGANLINRSTPIAFIASGKYWVNNHAHVLDCIDNVFMRYICLYINSISLVEYVTGTAQPKMNQEKMNSIMVFIPPYKEQIRILEKIEEVLPTIEHYGASQSRLDVLNKELYVNLRKSVLQEAIQGRLVAQDASEEPATILLQRIKEEKLQLVKEGKLKKKDVVDSVIFKGDDNKYFEKKGKDIVCIDEEIPFDIPESWQWCRINTVCNITNGFTPLRTEDKFWKDGDINWFTVEDIRAQGEYINFTAQKITKEATTPERIVRPGSILLCCTASVGQCAFTNIPTTTNQQFNALTIKGDYRPLVADEYLFLFAKTLKDELHRLSGKTTFEFISVKKVGNILVPIPPFNEQKRIVTIVNKSLASIMS